MERSRKMGCGGLPTRRGALMVLAGAALLVPQAWAADEAAKSADTKSGDPKPADTKSDSGQAGEAGKLVSRDGFPLARMVAGDPPKLDYGEGVVVPCNKGAFLTLWEGDTFWLTFGFASSARSERAKADAVRRAEAVMKYLLLTLTFAPDRLQKVEGHGWRQLVEDPVNYVIGDLEVPGRSSMPLTDANRGFGGADQSNLSGAVNPGVGGPGGGFPQMDSGPSGFDPSAMLTKVNAFAAFVAMKKDISLTDVRTRAKNVVL